MKGLISLILVLVLSTIAFGAGWDDATNLGGGIQLDDGTRYSSSSWQNGNNVSGSFTITMDPTSRDVNSANWSFIVDQNDSSQWRASCYLYGDRNSSQPWPQQQSWSQSGVAGSSEVSMYLSLYAGQYGEYDPSMDLYGYIYMTNSDLDSSSFMYEEYQYWSSVWDGQGQLVSQTITPAWRGTYNLYGHFVADTLEQAQAMGASFASVPEPGSVALLISGALVGGVIYWRRRRKK